MILIVEDDAHKSSQIMEVFNSVLGNETEVTLVDNVMDAVRFLIDHIPEKIILDMSLPSHKALPGQGTPLPLPTGGIEVLFELKMKNLMDLPVLILTQYPEIEIEQDLIPVQESAATFKEEYGFMAIEACYYDHSNNEPWKKKTMEFLK
jgi:CheY-like chemotaxis protein